VREEIRCYVEHTAGSLSPALLYIMVKVRRGHYELASSIFIYTGAWPEQNSQRFNNPIVAI
jgi:hypothetical protein